MKICQRCNKQFEGRKRYGGKPQKFCSGRCQSAAWMAAHQQSHKHKVLEWRRSFRNSNFCSVRNSELKKRFGITRLEWGMMFDEQLGICANDNCSNPATETDHNHMNGIIRGILCKFCNQSLGMLKDDKAKIIGLANYLEAYKGII
jgi:hypothetical protein